MFILSKMFLYIAAPPNAYYGAVKFSNLTQKTFLPVFFNLMKLNIFFTKLY